jgi:hypothetical protein
MPQHDLILDNASGAAFRADVNNALAALGSYMKGPNAPPAPLAGMIWVDDDTPSATIWTVKRYDGADWIEEGRIDIMANIYIPSEGVIAWADVASAATVDLGAQSSRSLRLTGTTTITSFGTAGSGVRKRLRIATGLTITHNAFSLICPGAANLLLGANDILNVESLGAGSWGVMSITRAAGGAGYMQIGAPQVVSGVSAVDFTLNANFRRFRLEISRGRVAAAGQGLGLRCGTGGVFDAVSTDYSYVYHLNTFNVLSAAQVQASFIELTGSMVAGDTRSMVSVEIDPGTSTGEFLVLARAGVREDTTPGFRFRSTFGIRLLAAQRDQIRIFGTSGANISGTFTLFGAPS